MNQFMKNEIIVIEFNNKNNNIINDNNDIINFQLSRKNSQDWEIAPRRWPSETRRLVTSTTSSRRLNQ